MAKDHVELDRVRHPEQREDAQQEAEIADPVDDEGLHRRSVGRRLAVVEPDQQVGGDAHAFPAEEQLQQVVGGHQHQHGEGEERQVGEEARPVALALLEVVVMGHVAEGIEVHERRDGGDHDQHDRRQPVDPDRPVGEERSALDPGEERAGIGLSVEAKEDDPAEQHGRNRSPVATTQAACSPISRQPKPQISAPTRGAKRRIVSICLSPSSR
jgi:hypothetical protein